MTEIKNTNYFTIQGWMVKELKLSGNELMAYAIIYGFSQDNASGFCGSRSYLSKFINVTTKTIDNLLHSLIAKGFVKKTEQLVCGVNVIFYRAVTNFTGGEKISNPEEKSSHNNKEDNDNKENLTKETDTKLSASLLATNVKQELQQMVIPETRNETTIEQVIDFFDKTYSLYPRKASRGRAQTTFIHKVFARDYTESRKRALYIYKCLERQIVEWANEGNGKGRGKDFMPYMSSWLNDNFDDVPKKERGKIK